MSHHNLNELFVFACIGIITGAPFFFRVWVQNRSPADLYAIDKMTSFLTTAIFIALFAGAFVFSEANRAVGEVLLVASILSFSFMYQSRWRAIQPKNPSSQTTNATRSFRASFVKLLFSGAALALLALFRQYPPLMALVLFAPLFIPLFIRMRSASEKMADSSFKTDILSVFRDAGVNLQEIYLIDSGTADQTQSNANAMVAGSRFGRGIFGRTLFITTALFETVTAPELHAILLHEASHFKLNHIPKRVIYGMIFLFLSLFWIAMPITLQFQQEPMAIVAATVAVLIAQFYLIGRLVYRQELEADLGAVQEGASRDALISALKKLNGAQYSQERSWLTRLVFGVFHPSGAEREKNLTFGEIPKSMDAIPHKPYCFAYSLFVVGFVFWSAQNRVSNDTRTPASNSMNLVPTESAPNSSAKISRSANG